MAPSIPDLNVNRPELPEQADKAFFLVASLEVKVQDAAPGSGLYVAGKIVNRAFVPDGNIEGEGNIGAGGGQPGWIELSDRSWHGAQTGRPPFPPFIEGVLRSDGTFSPSSRTVNR